MSRLQITLDVLTKPTRLDQALRKQFPRWGRQAINQLINQRKIRVNGQIVWLNSWKVKNGDRLDIQDPPEDLPDKITVFDERWLIQDDGDVIAVNKPAGLLSQGTQWKKDDNLLYLAEQRFGKVALFHRLDRDTSGVVLFTRQGAINQYLDIAFKAQTITKEYWAVVSTPNQLQSSGTIDFRLDAHPQRRDRMMTVERGGKSARTDYSIERKVDNLQLLRVLPQTGRTHQIRVHLEALGAPILGDRLYNPDADQYERLYLHAQTIRLPATDDFPARIYSTPLPKIFDI